MRNPVPFAREYPVVSARCLTAARRIGDRRVLADAARMRRDVLLDRLGLAVRPRLFGRTIACSSVGSLGFAFEDVVLSGRYMADLDTEQPVIIDCGANIGLSVLDFHRRHPGATITAFEPAPDAFANLVVNTEGIPRLRLEHVAVGAFDGKMQIWTEADSMRAGVHERLGVTQSVEVPVRRLSSYIDGAVDLLKLDVEGSEMDVLHDLETAGALATIKTMRIEFHHHLGDSSLADFLSTLERAGFVYQLSAGVWSPVASVNAFADIHIYASKTS